jgi:N-acetylglucosaminyldiphosphoundecaprenol N-acetyl-beta-D-mannosaminyltransferase
MNLPVGDWRQRWRTILDRTCRVATSSGLQELLNSLTVPVAPRTLAFVNAHAMNLLTTSTDFYHAIRSSDVLLRDGSGMATLFRMISQSAGLNLNGTDLIPKIIAQFDGKTIALLGSRNPYLRNAAAVISQQLAPHSRLVTAHGFLEVEGYLSLVVQSRPNLIVLGMGMPKQERVAVVLRAALPFPCLIVCGGAIIDFVGAKTPRAPPLIRQIGLEWLYRLALEPRRLFSRYVIGNPRFLLRALKFVLATSKEA